MTNDHIDTGESCGSAVWPAAASVRLETLLRLTLPPIDFDSSHVEKLEWFTQHFCPHFDRWVFGPIDRLVVSDDALVGFIMMTCAIDYLASFWWGESTRGCNQKAYVGFVTEYFPGGRYDSDGLYKSLRSGLLHMFTIGGAEYALVHNLPALHLKIDSAGRSILNAGSFRDDLKVAKNAYFEQVKASPDSAAVDTLLNKLLKRYLRDGFLGASRVELSQSRIPIQYRAL